MIEDLHSQVEAISTEDIKKLIDDFYTLRDQLEDVATRQELPTEYLAMLYVFGSFFEKNAVTLTRSWNIYDILNKLHKNPSSS